MVLMTYRYMKLFRAFFHTGASPYTMQDIVRNTYMIPRRLPDMIISKNGQNGLKKVSFRYISTTKPKNSAYCSFDVEKPNCQTA